ncbi:MAG: CCXG family PEP-CTERM protein [Proteobacteria bacterium]|nr:CCXG family PEP-CTERM protein [Pseudomonadota bacterium]
MHRSDNLHSILNPDGIPTMRLSSLSKLCSVLTLSALSLATQQANASVITMDTRYSASASLPTADAYRTTIDSLAAAAPTAGYGSTTLASFDSVSNQSVFGSATNIAFRYNVSFSSAGNGAWNFRIGPDFGNGGAVFLDGNLMGFKTNNMWWAGSYASTTQDFEFLTSLGSGNHLLQIYGLEDCCDGSQQAQFLAPGNTVYTSFSSTDGHNPHAVPEPASLPLALGAGVTLIGWQRRSRRQQTSS